MHALALLKDAESSMRIEIQSRLDAFAPKDETEPLYRKLSELLWAIEILERAVRVVVA